MSLSISKIILSIKETIKSEMADIEILVSRAHNGSILQIYVLHEPTFLFEIPGIFDLFFFEKNIFSKTSSLVIQNSFPCPRAH